LQSTIARATNSHVERSDIRLARSPETFPPAHRLRARLWQVQAESLAYREWDAELVVFNERTGHTHHLGPLGRAVLVALLARPAGMRIDEVTTILTGEFPDSEEAVSAVERTLEELTNLELIDCIPG
jgi:PqqD family protein of HPr-rel-A system